MSRPTHHTLLNGMIISFAFILANLRALVFIFLFPDTSVLLGPAWIEILLWALSTLGVVYILLSEHRMNEYLDAWRRNGLLALFILLAFLSILWTIAPDATLFRSLELLCATLIAAYAGMYFRSEQIMNFVFWFGAGLIILSVALVYGAPNTGTMYWAPFYGAWRGVYWHRNHLASIAAFLNAFYLCRTWIAVKARNNQGVLDGFFYVFSLVVLYFAKSATGYILVVVLHAFVCLVLLWLHISHRLRRQHYLFILGGMVLAAALILSNLDFVFGLFNRDASMTGRVGLWRYLAGIASQRLWLGHGFGAVWTLDSFREEIRQLVGWTSQPLIGDNGFLDVFLHLGIAGLLLLTGVLLTAIVRGIGHALTEKTLLAFFPLLIMVYALFANITFSLLAETEVFVWFLIVTVLFMPNSTKIKTA